LRKKGKEFDAKISGSSQTPLILLVGAQGFLVDVHLLSVKQMYCMRKEEREADLDYHAEDVMHHEPRRAKESRHDPSTFFGKSIPLSDEPFHQLVGRAQSSIQRR
jgi:hypothetical protein